MRRISIFTALAIFCLYACSGCGLTKWSFPKGRFRLISTPTEAAAPSTQPGQAEAVVAADEDRGAQTQSGDTKHDPSVERLNETVQQFVARFPPPDPERDRQQPATAGPSPQKTEPAAHQSSEARSAKGEATGRTTTQPAGQVVLAAGEVHQPLTGTAQPSASNDKPGTHAPLNDVSSPNPTRTSAAPTAANASVNTETAASPKPPVAAQPIESPPDRPTVEIVDIRPAAEPQPQSSAPSASANQPVHKGPQPESGDISRLIAQLEETVSQHPQQMDDQFKLRLLYLATGQTDHAIGPFQGVDPVQAELLSALFRTVAGAHDALGEPANGSRKALAAAADLQRLLAGQSPVMINKMALVTAVSSFGDYKPVEPPLFAAGQPVHVFCYCEVGNFHSEPTQDGRLRTLLAAMIEVFDRTGKIVWQQNIAQIEDLVHTPRRDFFLPLEIKLPAGLPPGEYVLKVGIEDKLAATTDQQRLTFTIGK